MTSYDWHHGPYVAQNDNPTPRLFGEDKVNEPSHYARFKIQPKTFIMANKLPFAEGNVVKYVCRHDAKDKAQDMLKVINYSISILEETYGVKAHLEID